LTNRTLDSTVGRSSVAFTRWQQHLPFIQAQRAVAKIDRASATTTVTQHNVYACSRAGESLVNSTRYSDTLFVRVLKQIVISDRYH